MIVWKEFTFDAAHYLPNVPEGHKCKRMHGHTFRVRLDLGGLKDPVMGWVVDFAEIKEAVKPLLLMLDHSVLNDYAGLENPTSENIAVWFFGRLRPALPMLLSVGVQETCDCGAIYRGD